MGDLVEEQCARNFASPERSEVRRRHLAVDEWHLPASELRHHVHERDLRGITLTGEHRFAKEHPAERDAIEPTSEALAVDRTIIIRLLSIAAIQRALPGTAR
jgi:hypothetical protein